MVSDKYECNYWLPHTASVECISGCVCRAATCVCACRCMQTTVAELERQLASGRAQVANTEKEREEVTRPPGDISL